MTAGCSAAPGEQDFDEAAQRPLAGDPGQRSRYPASEVVVTAILQGVEESRHRPLVAERLQAHRRSLAHLSARLIL